MVNSSAPVKLVKGGIIRVENVTVCVYGARALAHSVHNSEAPRTENCEMGCEFKFHSSSEHRIETAVLFVLGFEAKFGTEAIQCIHHWSRLRGLRLRGRNDDKTTLEARRATGMDFP
jgi:hypothetical protein